MPRDYRETIRALRAKAADPVVGAEERKALLLKAAEMEERHGLKDDRVKPLREETTITDRSGQSAHQPHTMTHEEFLRTMREFFYATQTGYFYERPSGKSTFSEETRKRNEEAARKRYEEAVRQTEYLWKRQQAWNRPPDEDDLISEDYKTNTPHSFHTTEDEDYGYDEWVKEGYDYDA